MPVTTENTQMTQNDDKTQDNSLNQVNSSLANPSSSNVQDTLDAIEKARKQEKDKLYQKMKELEDKNKQTTFQNNLKK